MKRILTTLCALAVAMAAAVPVLAAEQNPSRCYPVSIEEYMDENSGTHRVEKIYQLSADDDPAIIPTEDFEQEGYIYTLLDMTRQDQTETDSKLYTEPVTLESKNKDMEKILPLLPASREVTTEDGYTGILVLDTASVQVEAAGYGTSSKSVTATRSYPNLSDADTAFVPKTVEDNGRTLTLADVQWQEAGGFYHATATYTGTATNKYVTGYVVTANYTGEVSKTTSDTVVYTAIFSGEEISEEISESEIEQPATTLNFDSLKYPLIIAGSVMTLTSVGVFTFQKINKRRICH
jgi:hypothetical protein